MTQILTLVNQKGGVGKTTTAISLGAYLGYYGQRVLLIDLDPQANATASVGIDKRTVKAGTYEVLIGAAPIAPHIWHNPRYKISLLPSSPALAGAEIELVELSKREYRLRDAIQPVVDRYDYVLIDCPPSLSLLTINGLVAARNGLIIPVQCEYLALEGLSMLLNTVRQVHDVLNEQLIIAGVLLTMYDSRTNLGQQVADEVRRYFPKETFATIIPRNVRLSEAPSHGKTILSYAPLSAGAMAYQALAQEFLARAEGASPL